MEWFNELLNWDREIFLWLNAWHGDFMDTIMLMVTRKETWVPLYLTLIVLFTKSYRSKTLIILLFLAITVVASDQLSVLIKETVQRLRPGHEPSIADLVHIVLRKGGLHGFVSSHASNMFAIYVFTSRVFKNRSYSRLMFFWALIISYSRIYGGVHYPLDIIGGAILGSLIGWTTYKLLMFVENHFFIARSPKIEKTKLDIAGAKTVYLVFGVTVLTFAIMTHILHYYNFL